MAKSDKCYHLIVGQLLIPYATESFYLLASISVSTLILERIYQEKLMGTKKFRLNA